MREQIIEITGQLPLANLLNKRHDRERINPDSDWNYWMHIYPPLSSMHTSMPGTRQLCPWNMVAEVSDAATLFERKLKILEAMKSGQHIMRLYGLPAHRIMFMEDSASKKISVWVD